MRHILPLFAVLLMGFAPTPFPKPDPGKDDLKKMQGKWVSVFRVRDGVRELVKGEVIWHIKQNCVVAVENGKEMPDFYFALDARSTPRAIDICDSPKEKPRLFGRYCVNGDTLKLSIGKEKRPIDLSSDEGTFGVWVLERQKP
jgi:uncharacterized protein (TIGR03067 family)